MEPGTSRRCGEIFVCILFFDDLYVCFYIFCLLFMNAMYLSWLNELNFSLNLCLLACDIVDILSDDNTVLLSLFSNISSLFLSQVAKINELIPQCITLKPIVYLVSDSLCGGVLT